MKKKALREENVERNPFCILHFSSANAIIYFDLLQENEADTHTPWMLILHYNQIQKRHWNNENLLLFAAFMRRNSNQRAYRR